MRSKIPVTAAVLFFVVSASAAAVEPIIYEGDDPKIRLEVLGTYRGDTYDSNSSIEPAAYDPITKRLFVVSQDRGGVDVIDIHDPTNPTKIGLIDVSSLGLPSFVAVKGRIVVVALENQIETEPGHVAFFDVDGTPLANPVGVGAQPSMVSFTPNGRYVVVATTGEANDAYTIDPAGTVSIIKLRRRGKWLTTSLATDDFSGFNDQIDELRASGVRIFGPGATVSQDLEPESIAVSHDSRTAWVTMPTNNALAVVDIKKAEVTDILPFGFKDHGLEGQGLDASDKDGEEGKGDINIQSWWLGGNSLKGIYQPDLLSAYRAFGRTYLVTPNEGNPRDTEGFSERARVEDLDLDPDAFPGVDVDEIQKRENLGRLRVTKVEGDPDGDGDIDGLFSFGGRSFAIWTTDAELVFDSGDDFEQITALAVPDNFNSQDNESSFDDRSDQRGPEPEALTVGRVGLRQYAFIVLEQIGGVMVYDITNPQDPEFQLYFNNRDFSVNPRDVCGEDPRELPCAAAGDLGPEGALFIPRSRSPIRRPLLVVTHEISDTTTILKIERTR